MVKAKSLCFACAYRHIRITFFFLFLIFLLGGKGSTEDFFPPSFLSAISDQDKVVPLFWFSPHPDTQTLIYHGDQMLIGMYVKLPWRENCAAVKFSSPAVPFHLLKSRFYIPHSGTADNPDCDYTAPFFVTVNRDSAGIPQNVFLDSIRCSADDQDNSSPGEWVEIEHNLLMNDTPFWIVFHWEEDSPDFPMLGEDDLPNSGSSLWGKRNFFHFEWHPTYYNLMIQAQIVLNGQKSTEVDSFRVYRSEFPDSLMYQQNLIAKVPGSQFEHADYYTMEDQTYFYRVTCIDSAEESRASNLAEAMPKRGAQMQIDKDELYVHAGPGQPFLENLILTNSGGLPLTFRAQLNVQLTDWMGGSDSFGYCWTSNNLDPDYRFAWVDIQDRGIRLGSEGDDNLDYGFYDLGFSFPFYGGAFDSLRISSDGWLGFSHLLPCYSDTFKCYINQALPWLWGPYFLLAPFWDDLIFVDSSAIYFYSGTDTAVVSFINLHHYGQANRGPYTFQVILTPNGEIGFQYLNIPDSLYSATVGIQNRDGTVGLQLLYNEHPLCDSLALKIKPGWVGLDTWNGDLSPEESHILNLTFDPLCYSRGTYEAELLLDGWDKNHQLERKIIPLTFCIDTTTSVAEGDVETPQSIFLYQNYPNPFNPATHIEFTLPQPGQVKVEILNILGQKVLILLDEYVMSRQKLVVWDGKDDSGKELSSGIYFYRVTASEVSHTKKMLLLK
jgi:hypothetical protein